MFVCNISSWQWIDVYESENTYDTKFAILHRCCTELKLFALADPALFIVTQIMRGQVHLHPVVEVSYLDADLIGGDIQDAIIIEKELVPWKIINLKSNIDIWDRGSIILTQS